MIRVDPHPGGTLADTRGRLLRDLRISVTDRCNFRCTYCMPKAVFDNDYQFLPKSGMLSFEEIARVTRAIKRDLGRRAAVEPVIGHLKTDHRMDRNFLIGSHGDAANAVLAAVGYNFRRLVAWLREFLCAWLLVLFATRPSQLGAPPLKPM